MQPNCSELRLLGEFFVPVEDRTISNQGDLTEFACLIRPRGTRPVSVHAKLMLCSHIFRRAECRQGLQPPNTEFHKAIHRDSKTMTHSKWIAADGISELCKGSFHT